MDEMIHRMENNRKWLDPYIPMELAKILRSQNQDLFSTKFQSWTKTFNDSQITCIKEQITKLYEFSDSQFKEYVTRVTVFYTNKDSCLGDFIDPTFENIDPRMTRTKRPEFEDTKFGEARIDEINVVKGNVFFHIRAFSISPPLLDNALFNQTDNALFNQTEAEKYLEKSFYI